MEFGIWYPNRFPSGGNPSLRMLVDITKEAERLGYTYMTGGENFETMDLTTVLSAVAPFTGRMKLVTAILLLVQRGPVPSAKFLATLDHLTEGRVIAGIASGSSYRDWRYVGIDRTDMWARLDEATEALRALLTPDSKPFVGKHYSTEGITLYPYPAQKPLPIWIGSWGSEIGLRRVAKHADGWLSSAGPGHHTPEQFKKDREILDGFLREEGKDPATFPNACSTMRMYITESKAEIEQLDARSPQNQQMRDPNWGPKRPPDRPEDAPHANDMIGSRSECIEKLRRWKRSGCQALFVNPGTDDPVRQVRIFMEEVVARV